MIIKDYFADGLLQIAIVLSLLRSDLNTLFDDTSLRPLPSRNLLLETSDGPLSGITRIDANFHSRAFVRDYPKALESYSDRISAVLRDLHSLSDNRRFEGISTSVHAWLVNDGGQDGATSSREHPSAGNNAAEADEDIGQNIDSSNTAANEASADIAEPTNIDTFLEGELSKEVIMTNNNNI